jgi:hypothetical protein
MLARLGVKPSPMYFGDDRFTMYGKFMVVGGQCRDSFQKFELISKLVGIWVFEAGVVCWLRMLNVVNWNFSYKLSCVLHLLGGSPY